MSRLLGKTSLSLVASFLSTTHAMPGLDGLGGLGGGGDLDGMFKQETNCPAFQCPSKDEVPVQKAFSKKAKWPFVYGCDASSFDMMMMMDASALDPNNLNKPKAKTSQKLWKCCVNRDLSQQVCGRSKKEVEDEFSKCTNKKCGGDKNCKMQAQFGLMMGGGLGGDDKCKEYNDMQKANCDCVKKDKVQAKFRKALGNYYDVFAKDKLPKEGGKEGVTEEYLDSTIYSKTFKRGGERSLWHALFTKYSGKMQHKTRPKPEVPDYSKDLPKDLPKDDVPPPPKKEEKRKVEEEESSESSLGVDEEVVEEEL